MDPPTESKAYTFKSRNIDWFIRTAVTSDLSICTMVVLATPVANTPPREVPQGELATRSPTSSPHKKKTKKSKENTKCICGNGQCNEIMERLHMLGKTQYGYFNVPSKFKPPTAKKVTKKQKEERHVRTKKREGVLASLPMYARLRANDDSYSSGT